jgi:hypothetical protein
VQRVHRPASAVALYSSSQVHLQFPLLPTSPHSLGDPLMRNGIIGYQADIPLKPS